MDSTWDCVIVGGGAAGLSAALVLGRARRRTLLVDAGRPSNGPAEGIGGLLGQDGRQPREFYAAARAELAKYPTVHVTCGEVIEGAHHNGGFEHLLADGSPRRASTVLLAAGMDYRYPDLPGVAERWGRSVFHCPFCHGWERRDRRLGVIGRGVEGVERAVLLTASSDDVMVGHLAPAHRSRSAAGRGLGAAGPARRRRRAGERAGPDLGTGVERRRRRERVDAIGRRRGCVQIDGRGGHRAPPRPPGSGMNPAEFCRRRTTGARAT